LSDRRTSLKPESGLRGILALWAPAPVTIVTSNAYSRPHSNRGSRPESRPTLISIKVDGDEIVFVERSSGRKESA
jgi:hypothetical protein